jgi:hypothetical protein
MVDGKQAVVKAKEYLQAVYEPAQVGDLRLEEMERSEDDKQWSVTLSFIPHSPQSPGVTVERVFKTVKIVAETGEILAMKIRKP